MEMQAPIKKGPSEMEKVLRKQMAEEIGDEDVQIARDDRIMLLQKFGLMAPRITRATSQRVTRRGQIVVQLITKPHWFESYRAEKAEEFTWKSKRKEWDNFVRGAVTPLQHTIYRQAPPSTAQQPKSWKGPWKERPPQKQRPNSPMPSSGN